MSITSPIAPLPSDEILSAAEGALSAQYFALEFTGDKAQAAQLIAERTLKLRQLAQEANLPFVAYLLEMAFREAFMTGVNSATDDALKLAATATPVDGHAVAGVQPGRARAARSAPPKAKQRSRG